MSLESLCIFRFRFYLLFYDAKYYVQNWYIFYYKLLYFSDYFLQLEYYN